MTAMSLVLDDGACLGFILRRGPIGVEAFDREARSLGLFKTEAEAAKTVLGAAEPGRSAG
jgi:hypothetical protein